MADWTLWHWALALVCAGCIGIAKTGVPGFGILVIPTLVLIAGGARQSAGLLLPLLCAADLFAVLFWRRHADQRRILELAPGVLAGMAGGALALRLSDTTLRYLVAAIVIVMLSIYLWRKRRPEAGDISGLSWPYGVAAGFSTTVANAAGPVMNLYLLSRKLSKEEFLGTGAWFFFAVNLAKVPLYVSYKMITPASLTLDLKLLPAVVAGALTGRWIVHHIPPRVFEGLVVALTVVATVLLLR